MLLIDFNNLIHAAAANGRELTTRSLESLLLMSRFATRGAIVVCDGAERRSALSEEGAGTSGGSMCRIIFAGPRSDADSVIERLLNEDSSPRRFAVISTDRRVRAAARRRGAESLTSEEFLRAIARDSAAWRRRADGARREEFMDEAEVLQWLKVFDAGEKPAVGASPAAATPEKTDPLLREAMERGELSAEELDMQRWLGPPNAPSSEG